MGTKQAQSSVNDASLERRNGLHTSTSDEAKKLAAAALSAVKDAAAAAALRGKVEVSVNSVDIVALYRLLMDIIKANLNPSNNSNHWDTMVHDMISEFEETARPLLSNRCNIHCDMQKRRTIVTYINCCIKP